MKNMTFNSIFVIVLVTKIIESTTVVFLGTVKCFLENNLDKIEENSFLKKVYSWMEASFVTLLGVSVLVADIISVFVLSFIF